MKGKASVNPVRFSSKYQDNESGCNYYGHRFYNPDTGRWLNRDPIGEAGGENVYALLNNYAIGNYDILGLAAGENVWQEAFDVMHQRTLGIINPPAILILG